MIRRCTPRWKQVSSERAITCLEGGTLHSPSIDDLTGILQQCRRKKNLDHALQVHVYMCQCGLDSHESLSNLLVTFLSELGTVSHAQQAFDVSRRESLWNALIMGYIQKSKLRQALHVYERMQEDYSVQPSDRTLVALLKACTRLKDLERGGMLHCTIANLGLLENNLFIGATLVDMYAKCGALLKAQQVLDNLATRDVVSWNALISGYTEHAYNGDALMCFEQLQLEGLCPNAVTFVCALKACAGQQAAEMGREIHAETARNGLLEASIFVGNTLVDMYARCGLLSKAQEVHNGLPVKDVVSFNSLILGYTEHGNYEDALECFRLMAIEGITPNSVTYICSLKAIGKAKDTLMGKEVHAEAARQGWLEKDIALGNALVDMYAKCGFLAKAQEVFDNSAYRDVVSYNALITGYAEYKLGEEAFACFSKMQAEGIAPDVITFVCILKACGGLGLIVAGQEVHAEIIKKGLLEGDLGIGNSLIDVYSKCGWCLEARFIFNKLPRRDLVSWNTLISGYVEHGYSEEGLECYEQMELEGVVSDAVTFVTVVNAVGNARALDKGQEIHVEIIRKRLLEVDPFIGSALVDMYIKCGEPATAQEVFDTLLIRDTVVWNALIAGYAEHDLGQEALKCFERMQLQGVASDSATFICILKSCCNVGAINKGRKVHLELCQKGLEDESIVVGNTLVDMYAKCGSVVDAQKVLSTLEARDVVSWNALIAGYSQLGENEMVFLSLDRMKDDGIKPNAITFTSILKACSHAALSDKGRTIYDGIIHDHEITPTIEHQNCMVDLYCRAGHLDKAIAFVQKMQCPDLVAWDSVLSACKKWGNFELGFQAFENFVHLDPDDAGAYLAMSHLCTDVEMEEALLLKSGSSIAMDRFYE